MVISILGIVFLQGYWIYSSWETKEEEFSLTVSQSLQNVATEIQEREINDYLIAFDKLIDSVGRPNDSNFTDIFFFLDENETSNLSTFFAYGILQESYNINPEYLDPRFGSKNTVEDYKSVRTQAIVSNDFFNRENQLTSSLEKIKRVERLNRFDQVKYREAFTEYASIQPIHKRVSNPELAYLLDREFQDKKITIPYQFGIFNDGLSTKIRSNNFQEITDAPRYEVPIFANDNGRSTYALAVIFPDKNRYMMSSIFGVAGLSLLLSVFIILVSAGALYQIIQQKKISEIKTDFINNMSHEFKTPIATINLALDAMGNAKVIKAPDAILRYANMIREENNRMLTQVENVLRISQLERGSAPMEKSTLDLHVVIEDAISHVALLVEDKKGSITKQFTSSNAPIFANQNHFVNVLVNILDNAIKYADGPPKIDVYTDVTTTHVSLTIKDQGIGMDQKTQKHIFEKFYREQGGNIHNIKGHGLGLAYVKRIVDLHEGKIQIDSKKGKGTSFSIFLPLINPMT